MHLVLASSSPRRHQLLREAGLRFEVIPSPADEVHDADMLPGALCELNALLKAQAVAIERPDAWVIGADTLVFIDNQPLGKPKDHAHAREMLRLLSGRTHQVCTGVCMIPPSLAPQCFHEVTEVTFRCLTEVAITDYFARVNPLDKAGAYGIQEHGERLIAEIAGSFDNVMGLPVSRLLAVLESYNLDEFKQNQ